MVKESSLKKEIGSLAALHSPELSNALPAPNYDHITRRAQLFLSAPISFICFFDAHRLRVLSAQGLSSQSTNLYVSFCSYAINHHDLFIVQDASLDERFKDNILVTGPAGIRFYASYPLRNSDGLNVGLLCVIDHKARVMHEEQADILRMLGKLVEVEINLGSDRMLLENLNYQKKCSQLISSWQSAFFEKMQQGSVFESILRDLLEFTKSQYGFIGEVLLDHENDPYLKMVAVTNVSLRVKSNAFDQVNLKNGMEVHNLDSLFGKALASKKLFIFNDIDSDPNMSGITEETPQLHRFAGIPVYAGDDMIALIGLVNRTSEYTAEYIKGMAPLLVTIGLLIASRRLRSQEKKVLSLLEQVSEHVPGMIYQFKRDKDGKISFPYASSGIRLLYNVEPDEVAQDASAVLKIIHPDDVEGLLKSVELSASNLTNWRHEYRVMDNTGTQRWLSGYAAPQAQDDGAIIWHGYITDITEQRFAAEKISLATKVFSNAAESIIITDIDGVITDVNPSFEVTTGFKRIEVLGRRPSMLRSGRHDQSFYETLWNTLINRGFWSGDIFNKRKNGDVFLVNESISAVYDEAGRVHQYVAVFSDITSQRAAEKRLDLITHYDALTGLPNRILLSETIEKAISHANILGTSLAIAYLDLDRFKDINDEFGHEFGDKYLCEFALNLKAVMNPGDTLARLGGDEFAALINLSNEDSGVDSYIQRLLKTSERPIFLDGKSIFVSVSIGVVLYPNSSSATGHDVLTELEEAHAVPDQLLRQADYAMYQAKLAGKNQYKVFDTYQDRLLRKVQINTDRIRQGMEKGEFLLWYQPKVNMRTGEVVGFEALVRWQHPERGFLQPAQFLEDIEHSSISIEFDLWLLEKAIAQISSWNSDSQLTLTVSVNISAQLLQLESFYSALTNILLRHPSVQPAMVEFEILETAALERFDSVIETIQKIRALGIGFSLDDFGTGYSSLTYLRRLPVETLKIDRSFVIDFITDDEDMAIVKSIIKLAGAFGRGMVAEGVETIEHGELLLDLGCDLAQGYVVAYPMPAADVPVWVATWEAPVRWVSRESKGLVI